MHPLKQCFVDYGGICVIAEPAAERKFARIFRIGQPLVESPALERLAAKACAARVECGGNVLLFNALAGLNAQIANLNNQISNLRLGLAQKAPPTPRGETVRKFNFLKVLEKTKEILNSQSFETAVLSYSSSSVLKKSDAVVSCLIDKSGVGVLFFTAYHFSGLFKKKVVYDEHIIGDVIDDAL